jgi:1,4-alpha-glucan branching enzyme
MENMRILSIPLLWLLLVVFSGCAGTVKLNRAEGKRGDNAPLVTANGVRFSVSAPGATLVTLVGNFNGWNDQATPLTVDGKGTWSVTLPLKKGQKYEYKFVVDGFWVADPDNPDFEKNGSGSVNSFVKIQ